MMENKRFYMVLGSCCLLLFWLWQIPCVFVEGVHGPVAVVPARARMPLAIHFIHSVQKTPVEEELEVNAALDGFDLKATKYQSFGVGLPFLASEGGFKQQGDVLVLGMMDRRFSSLALRTGVGTALSLELAGKCYRLYELLPVGSEVKLYIAPWYRKLVGYFTYFERNDLHAGKDRKAAG